MGVQTAADDLFDSAAEHINQAIKNLTKIISDEPWGHDEYDHVRISQVVHDLMLARRILKNQEES